MPGVLALIGGLPFTDGCDFDRDLLAAAGDAEVVVMPTAAAYEHPEREVQRAADWFAGLGGTVRPLMVLRRPEADDEANAKVVREARFLYLPGGSPMHLRSVLKDSAVWAALVEAWQEGAVVAGAEAGAQVLTDPMVDPRGGAFTLGLGLMGQLAVVPHHDHWSEDKARRTLDLAPARLCVVGIDDRTALVRDAGGAWSVAGAGAVAVFRDGEPGDLSMLP